MNSPSQSQALQSLILKQIQSQPQQRITFAEFMDLALYHPQWGYYLTQAPQMGHRGDFVTATHLGADLGELLAEQLLDCWQNLGQPQPCSLLEMGAGQGLLAEQMLSYLQRTSPDYFQCLQYGIVERSPTLQKIQQERLANYPVKWFTWADIPKDSIIGCCFSNELVDAFPVHLVEVGEDRLQEVYVGASDDPHSPFSEILGELSTPALADYFLKLQIDLTSYESGYRTEVNLAALDWLKEVCDRLQTGYLITIDYGYPAHRYYRRARRTGTLQCYSQHAHHSDPYRYVGHQDITAHVNFTALEKHGLSLGLETLGFIEQGLFLMALGLGDRIAALSEEAGIRSGADLQARLQRRQFLHTLIDPYGMGNFGVLVQSKGLSSIQMQSSLKGFTTPSGGSFKSI